MKKNLWLLAIAQGLFLTNNVVFIAINGLVGLSLAPAGWMATLPVMGYVVGGALSTGPVARSQQRWGRKVSFQLGLLVAVLTVLLCAFALHLRSFWLLVAGTVIAGYYSANGQLYRFAAGGGFVELRAGVGIANTVCWSPDTRTFYFADTADGRIRAYDYDGSLRNARTLVERDALPGRPDGATVDAEGFIWSARYGGGGIARIDPSGRVERFLRLPICYSPEATDAAVRALRRAWESLARTPVPDQSVLAAVV